MHQINTSGTLNNLTVIPQSRTSFYGTHSVISKWAIAWNKMQNELEFSFKDCDFKTLKINFSTDF